MVFAQIPVVRRDADVSMLRQPATQQLSARAVAHAHAAKQGKQHSVVATLRQSATQAPSAHRLPRGIGTRPAVAGMAAYLSLLLESREARCVRTRKASACKRARTPAADAARGRPSCSASQQRCGSRCWGSCTRRGGEEGGEMMGTTDERAAHGHAAGQRKSVLGKTRASRRVVAWCYGDADE
jgi:hypothetical protein